MLVFGHVGITLGAAVIVNGVVSTCRKQADPAVGQSSAALRTRSEPRVRISASSIASWFASLGSFLDIRILMVGSLVPDIIDKPISVFLTGNGRAYAHTLALTVLVFIAAMIMYLRQRKTWLIAISGGMFTHLILDSMWLNPKTLLWPLYGRILPTAARINPLPTWLSALHTNTEVYVGEALGFVVVLLFVLTLFRNGKFVSFLTRGKL